MHVVIFVNPIPHRHWEETGCPSSARVGFGLRPLRVMRGVQPSPRLLISVAGYLLCRSVGTGTFFIFYSSVVSAALRPISAPLKYQQLHLGIRSPTVVRRSRARQASRYREHHPLPASARTGRRHPRSLRTTL